MLSAYMRFKYPGVIAGSIASSAPILLLDPDFPNTFFWKTVTKVYKRERRERERVMVFHATFNNISAISLRSVLLVEKTRNIYTS
jgi:hypothetical protein